jgi:anaerobic ribonucleoside-triphosphate reductase activating protein
MPGIEGVTLSGGEPMEQVEAVCRLLTRVRRETDLSTLLFSGYTLEEIETDADRSEVLSLLDVLIAGPFDEGQRRASSLIGSANQQVHLLTARYTLAEIERVPPSEVHITSDGQVLITGIHPQQFKNR